MNCLLRSQGTPISTGWCRVGDTVSCTNLATKAHPPFSKAIRGHSSQKRTSSCVRRRRVGHSGSLDRTLKGQCAGPAWLSITPSRGKTLPSARACPERDSDLSPGDRQPSGQPHQATKKSKEISLALMLLHFPPAIIPDKYRDMECFPDEPES